MPLELLPDAYTRFIFLTMDRGVNVATEGAVQFPDSIRAHEVLRDTTDFACKWMEIGIERARSSA